MREDPAEPSRVATGGKENCLKIYDLNRPDVGTVFKAKNVSLALGQSMCLCYKYIHNIGHNVHCVWFSCFST